MNIALCVADLTVNILEYLILLKFYGIFLDKRNRSTLLTIILGGAHILTMQAVNSLQITLVNTLFFFICILAVALFLYKGKVTIKIVLATIYAVLPVSSEMLVTLLLSLTRLIIAQDFAVEGLLLSITGGAGKLLVFVLVYLIGRLFPGKRFGQNSNDIVLLTIFPVMGIATMYIILNFVARLELPLLDNLLLILFVVGMLAIDVLLFFFYDRAMQNKELESKLNISKKIHEMNEVLFKEQQRCIEAGRGYIHDFKNHLANIQTLYQTGQSEAVAYQKELINRLDQRVDYQLIDVNNYVVSNILERLRRRCEIDNIDLAMDIRYNQLGFLDNLDASTLLDNAFDNALAACTLLEQCRRIGVRLYNVNSFIVLSVTNTKKNPVIEKDGHILSTRRNYKDRGYGIENIKLVAERYEGDAAITYSDD